LWGPQGSILGPLLFLINDIASCGKFLHFLLFAADANILCSDSDVNGLFVTVSKELLILADRFRANRLSINVEKPTLSYLAIKELVQLEIIIIFMFQTMVRK